MYNGIRVSVPCVRILLDIGHSVEDRINKGGGGGGCLTKAQVYIVGTF